MQWLGDTNLKPLEKIKEEDSSTTLHASTDPSISPEQSMESFCDTAESNRERGSADTSVEMPNASGVDRNIERLKEDNPTQTTVEEAGLENEYSDVLNSEEGCMDLQEQSAVLCSETGEANSLKQNRGQTEDRTSNEFAEKSCDQATEIALEMNSEQAVASSVNALHELASPSDTVCTDDVILSSSQNPGLPNMNKTPDITDESGQVTNNEPSLEMSSTPKPAPYRDVEGEQDIEMDKEGYREGISKDSGIHESKEDVLEGDSNDGTFACKSFNLSVLTCRVCVRKFGLCVLKFGLCVLKFGLCMLAFCLLVLKLKVSAWSIFGFISFSCLFSFSFTISLRNVA